jgi:hypothetical protein
MGVSIIFKEMLSLCERRGPGVFDHRAFPFALRVHVCIALPLPNDPVLRPATDGRNAAITSKEVTSE